jgi:hypothetical protein
MKRSLGLAFALTILMSVSAASQNVRAPQNVPVLRHHRAQPATKRIAPAAQSTPQDTMHRPLTPYPQTGEGDNDGLSRDPDDCNKGCIGGNPG